MRTRIIAAFPGTGKTHYCNNHPTNCLDSDSSKFSWIYKEDGTKERNPQFPDNYIEHIKDNIGKYKFIFVSTHKVVREALLDNCLFFYLIYPKHDMKEIYLKRYRDRNSPEEFISLLSDNWDEWIRSCFFCGTGCKQIQMLYDFLDKELLHIVASENGEC